MTQTLLSRLWNLFGFKPRTQSHHLVSDEELHAELSRAAPRVDTGADAGRPAAEPQMRVMLCREAVLGRDQRIAGYYFKLQSYASEKIQYSSRRIRHLHAEIMVNNLVQLDLAKLLGHRQAFIDLPYTFLDHEAIAQLPPQNVVLIAQRYEDDAPSMDEVRLAEIIALRRQQGFRIALEDPLRHPGNEGLLGLADLIVLSMPELDAAEGLELGRKLSQRAPQVRLLVRDVPSLEEFAFVYKLGAIFFQGRFISSREDWRDRKLGPDATRVAMILKHLREDADTHDIAEMLKRDAALSVRLLRYINSAGVGLQTPVSSIEKAMLLLGRQSLYRWLALLLCGSSNLTGRASAGLENALVRARLMELLMAKRPVEARDAAFLVGLLSLVDVVLQVPLEQALDAMSVAPDIRHALLQRQGEWAGLLAIAEAFEHANGEEITSACAQQEIDPVFAAACHSQALAWVLASQEV